MPFNSSIPRITETSTQSNPLSAVFARAGAVTKHIIASKNRLATHIFTPDRVVKIALAVLSAGLLIVLGRLAYIHYWMAQHDDTLYTLSSYDMTDVLSHLDTPDLSGLLQTVQDTTTEIQTYATYLSSIQAPYYYLLQRIYLPSLNLWKNPYTQALSLDVVGQHFIDVNPLNNTNIIAFWSNYLKSSLNDVDTRILDVVVGDTDFKDDYYAVPVTITFEAPNKRAFLMVVDKLSLTSNLDSLALIQKFVYTLREDIRSRYISIPGGQYSDVDKDIGYVLDNRLHNKGTQTLIDDASILRVIGQLAHCSSAMSQDACLYAFRDIYRSVPSLAYGISSPYTTDRVAALRDFLTAIPPLLRIQDFSFVPMQSTAVNNTHYQGRVTFLMYGKNVSADDVSAMASYLGTKCMGKDVLYPSTALELVDGALRNVGQLSLATQQQSADLVLLKNIINEQVTTFDDKSLYDQMIALIELYTMLADANVCTVN